MTKKRDMAIELCGALSSARNALSETRRVSQGLPPSTRVKHGYHGQYQVNRVGDTQERTLLTPMQAAAALEVTRDKLTRLTMNGSIVSTRTGGGYHRYDPKEIARCRTRIAQGTLKPRSAAVALVSAVAAPAPAPASPAKAKPQRHLHRYQTANQADVYDSASRQVYQVSHKRCICGAEREVVRKYTPLGTRVVEIRRIA